MIIAIDGPAGSGKSTTARALAKKLNFIHIDTGAMYRAVTLYVIENNIDYSNNKSWLSQVCIEQEYNKNQEQTTTFLNNRDVSFGIRSNQISEQVGKICQFPYIRRKLVDLQRVMGKKNNVVLEGRDIGTEVFPNADFKFYIYADIKIRAKRRFDEMANRKENICLEDIETSLLKRDSIDMERSYSPLKQAQDAIPIDTGHMTIDEQVNYLYDIITKNGSFTIQ